MAFRFALKMSSSRTIIGFSLDDIAAALTQQQIAQ